MPVVALGAARCCRRPFGCRAALARGARSGPAVVMPCVAAGSRARGLTPAVAQPELPDWSPIVPAPGTATGTRWPEQ